jgi:hypothetical protein
VHKSNAAQAPGGPNGDHGQDVASLPAKPAGTQESGIHMPLF